MANPEHVAKLMEGADAWNAWRKTADERPDLSGLELMEETFVSYDLTAANLSNTRLSHVTFWGGWFDGISFEGANLFELLFWSVELQRSTFARAKIQFSRFHLCNLSESDFTAAELYGNAFTNASLTSVRGLDTSSRRWSPNSIGIETFFESGGLPEAFLRSSGVPEEFIEYAASLVGKAIEYYSCFISYSSNDDEFARRIYNDLQGKKISTWWAPEELKIGDRFRSRIDESIRIHDKLVLILSANSVN